MGEVYGDDCAVFVGTYMCHFSSCNRTIRFIFNATGGYTIDASWSTADFLSP